MCEKIAVSVHCITYNHEKYIADAIESFLMQKTNFDFEVLIHDDASIDGTTRILKEYERKYPELIKVVYQKENQHSKGIKVRSRFLKPITNGKYIATCEGDDFWIDKYKLQKQYDVLENNSNVSMVSHVTSILENNENYVGHIKPRRIKKIYNCKDVIINSTSFHTSSKMYRAKLLQKNPGFFSNSPGGMVSSNLFLSYVGDVYFINENMSCWRKSTKGSFTERTNETNESYVKLQLSQINLFNEFDKYTSFKYRKHIIKAIRKREQKVRMKTIKLFPFTFIFRKQYYESCNISNNTMKTRMIFKDYFFLLLLLFRKVSLKITKK